MPPVSDSSSAPLSSLPSSSSPEQAPAAPGVSTAPAVTSPPSVITFLPYLKSAKFSDAVLKIKTSDGKVKTLPVHRIVLSARSKFFEDLFNGPQPSEINSKGLPVYGVPVLPVHRALQEVLGLSLWWVYSLDDTKVTLPENKWDQIIGVQHISNVFKFHRLLAESEQALKNAIERGGAQPDELFKIAEEAKKWCFPDIEKRVSTRLQELLLNPDAADKTLASTSVDTLSSIVDSLEPGTHFALVRRYLEVRAAGEDPVPLEANARLWSRVPFSKLDAADLESAYSDPNVPSGAVVEATLHALLLDHNQATGLSYNLLSAALDLASSSGPPMSQSQVYRIVRAYNAAHIDLDESRKDRLWTRVRFVELPVEELEEAYSSTDVPQEPVVAAMFSRSQYDLTNKPVPATPPQASYGHRSTSSHDYGTPSNTSYTNSSMPYAGPSIAGHAPMVPAPAGLGAGTMGFDPYSTGPSLAAGAGGGDSNKSDEKKRFAF
ncbi:hypothetical protein HDU93_004857 [Gonapodya sp. JEL0774]|nr:hypothetical protein HDU93_004857 [Gonapodya sp. JEL0774]